ncbi:MAG: DUF3159 domain-containing protein [Fusobacteriota bacterium]
MIIIKLSREILEELKSVISGKTIDAIIPPSVFMLVNNMYGLKISVISAISIAFLIGTFRFLSGDNWKYAFGGLIGVIIASGLAFLGNNATNYFLPDIFTSGLLLILIIISLLMKKPFAAWVSHITRGWDIEWFWRKDVKPAYKEVTWFWGLVVTIRMIIQIMLFMSGDTVKLFWAKTLLGFPSIIIILIITYIYGIWRLKKLGGPGIQEYKNGKKPPWEGQKRGF